MPRYKYSCESCKLDDVKQINYEFEGLIQRKLCGFCNKELKRVFLNPPKDWFNNSGRQRG